MGFDLDRVVEAAVRAAVDDQGSGKRQQQGAEKGKRHGLSAGRGFLIGAGLVTAGRLVIGGHGRDMLENLQQRLVEYEERHFSGGENEDDEAHLDEDYAEGENLEDDEYDEPSDEYDEEESEGEYDEEESQDQDGESEQERRATASGSKGRRNRR